MMKHMIGSMVLVLVLHNEVKANELIDKNILTTEITQCNMIFIRDMFWRRYKIDYIHTYTKSMQYKMEGHFSQRFAEYTTFRAYDEAFEKEYLSQFNMTMVTGNAVPLPPLVEGEENKQIVAFLKESIAHYNRYYILMNGHTTYYIYAEDNPKGTIYHFIAGYELE